MNMPIDPKKLLAFLTVRLLDQQPVWLKVTSGSMAPMIPTGSRILVESVHETRPVRFGEIVVFRDAKSNLIVHRVLFTQTAKNRFLQCGDNAQSPGFIAMDNICGVVKKVAAHEKEFDCTSYPAKLFNIVMGITSVWILGMGKFRPEAGWFFRRLRCKVIVTMMSYV